MRRISFASAIAIALSGASVLALQQQTVPMEMQRPSDDKDITLTGCVVKGDDGAFLLTGVTATAGAPATQRVLYWLDDEDELEGHAGHRVEVKGELEGEIEKGEIEIERENGVVELEVKSGGKRVVARFQEVPAAVGTAGVARDKEVEIEYVVRKVDVKSVKMLADTCR